MFYDIALKGQSIKRYRLTCFESGLLFFLPTKIFKKMAACYVIRSMMYESVKLAD